MTELTPDNATLLAILAGSPHTDQADELMSRIHDDPVARDAARLLTGRITPEQAMPAARKLAEAIKGWAERNRTYLQRRERTGVPHRRSA